jgi:hypothetical protein
VLSPFAMIGYEVVSRFNPSYRMDRVEEVYFEKENDSRRKTLIEKRVSVLN